jgi:hypothetical protein
MFDCMKQLVQQQELAQQQHHDSPHHHQQLQASQQMVACCAAAGSCSAPAAASTQCLAGMDAPEALSFKLPCPQEQAAAATAAACMPGACCMHCNFGKPGAADEQALLRTTWQQHFLPLLLDMHAALTCAVNPFACKPHSAAAAAEQPAAAAHGNSSTCSFAAAARIPNALEGWAQHNTAAAALHPFSSVAAGAAGASSGSAATAAPAAAHQVSRPAILLELAGCSPPPVDVAGQMLIGVVEFLALHSCWCNMSFLLAEAFKNGLLASTGVLAAQQLQRLHELQRLQAPVCSAALTAASLVASLGQGAAAVDEEEAAEAASASKGAAALQRAAGSTAPYDSCSKGSKSNTAADATSSAPAPATQPTRIVCAPPGSAVFKAASTPSHHLVATVRSTNNNTVLAVLLLLLMPAAALLVAAAAGSGEMHVQGTGASVSCSSSPAGLAASADVVCVLLYTALLSAVLLVMVVVTGSRQGLRRHV